MSSIQYSSSVCGVVDAHEPAELSCEHSLLSSLRLCFRWWLFHLFFTSFSERHFPSESMSSLPICPKVIDGIDAILTVANDESFKDVIALLEGVRGKVEYSALLHRLARYAGQRRN